MKIKPTKGEYNAIRKASEVLSTICEPGKKCDDCFMNERSDGESCCPASHLISTADELTNELICMALDTLNDNKSEVDK